MWTICERFDDGRALFTAVCELGFERVVAKNHSSLYRLNDRGWVKVKTRTFELRRFTGDDAPKIFSRSTREGGLSTARRARGFWACRVRGNYRIKYKIRG